jgi:hypothetical protein
VYITQFVYARLKTGRIMWLGIWVWRVAGVHTGFRTITLVLYIGSLPWFPCGKGTPYLFWGHEVKGQGYYKYIFGQQGRFRMVTLVLYIGSFPNLATWFLWERGRTLFILGSLGQNSRSLLLWIYFLTTGSFPHDHFSSVYWISTKLGHMIPLWMEKNPIYFGVISLTR